MRQPSGAEILRSFKRAALLTVYCAERGRRCRRLRALRAAKRAGRL